MLMSRMFSQTRREVPSDADLASHQLLIRAGYIRPLAAGIFTYLPLALRSLQKIQNIMREEINSIGGQEINMPVVQPADLWKETGRWYQIGTEMGRFKDKSDRDMVLAMTHEEATADLVRNEVRSYRQLPALIYHIQTKWRDDPRPRAGLIRAREFTMLDSYSLDADWEGLAVQYKAHYDAYKRIFARCGLPVVTVESDSGMMGGKEAHEFMYLNPAGEDTLLHCPSCGYSANREVADFHRPVIAPEEPAALQKVATPEARTIEELSNFLHITPDRTAKAVFLVATPAIADLDMDIQQEFIFVVVRGDMELNEIKLANEIKAMELRPATEEEIISIGAAPGFASPVGLNLHDPSHMPVKVVVDELIPSCFNLVAGANEAGYHLLNVNYGRDYTADIVADIASASEGSACPVCSKPMQESRGIEMGHIFKLGTRYSEAMGCTFTAEDGSSKPVIMGSYGIGLGRLLACIAEEHHDEKGLCLPVSVAPYQVHVVGLASKTGETEAAAQKLYTNLTNAGVEVLYDDRIATAGVKFNDADLIGIPIRLTIGERGLKQGGVEYKLRTSGESGLWMMEEIQEKIKAMVQ
jgi:prolyl-tRNA synthetase